MNMNRIVSMIMRIFVAKLVHLGINAGMSAAANRSEKKRHAAGSDRYGIPASGVDHPDMGADKRAVETSRPAQDAAPQMSQQERREMRQQRRARRAARQAKQAAKITRGATRM